MTTPVPVSSGPLPAKAAYAGPVWILVLLLAASLALCACSDDKTGRQRPREAAPVTTAPVIQKSVPIEVRAVGVVEAFATVKVRTTVVGPIVGQYVWDGQDVKAGDTLVQIDPRPYESALKEAQARLERDRALLQKARDDQGRYTDLKRKSVVSQEQYDQTLTAMRSLEATTRLDEAQVEAAKVQLEYTTIKAPIPGRVGTINLPLGNVLRSGDDRDILVLNQYQPVRVSFSVPEKYLQSVFARLAGDGAEVLVYSDQAKDPEVGKVTVVDNAVDKVTGTIRLKAEFLNQDKKLWPGQFARVVLRLGRRENALLMPSQAGLVGLNGDYVYVLKPDKTVESRVIQIGPITDGMTQVEKGLSAGESVITDGHVRLFPGAKVEVRTNPDHDKQEKKE